MVEPAGRVNTPLIPMGESVPVRNAGRRPRADTNGKRGRGSGELAEVYAGIRASNPSGSVADIMKTMSLRPDVLRLMSEVAARLPLSEGALSRANHEMITAHVSALNRCHY